MARNIDTTSRLLQAQLPDGSQREVKEEITAAIDTLRRDGVNLRLTDAAGLLLASHVGKVEADLRSALVAVGGG